MKFKGIGEKGFIGILDKDMTIDELVSLIARNTHRTADEIEAILIGNINSFFMSREELIDEIAAMFGKEVRNEGRD